MMKGLGYVRVSTDMQRESGLSIAYQREKITAYAAAMDIELVAIIEDAGKSGRGMTQREGLQKCFSMLRKKENGVSGLIVLRLDRLTRSLSDLTTTISAMDRWGAALISIQDNICTSSATGRLLVNLIGSISQWMAEDIAEKTEQAIGVLKGRCQRYSSKTPYGYDLASDSKTLTKNADEQRTITMMREMRSGGMSYQSISESLNNKRVPTKNGATWHPASVRHIIINA